MAHLGLDSLLPNRHVSRIRERIANVEKHLTLLGGGLFPHGGERGVGRKARERGHDRALLVLPACEHVALARRRGQLAHGPAAVDVHALHRVALARVKRERYERVVVHHGERHARVAVLIDRDLLVHHPAAGNVIRRAGHLPEIKQLALVAVQVVLGQKHRGELHRVGHARVRLDAGLGLRARLTRGDGGTAVRNLKPRPVSARDLDPRERRRATGDDLAPVRVLVQANHNAGHRARVVRTHRNVAGGHRERGHALIAGSEDLLGAVRQGKRPVVDLPGHGLLLSIGCGVRGGLFVARRVELDRLALGRLEGRRIRLRTIGRHGVGRRLAQDELVVHDVHGPQVVVRKEIRRVGRELLAAHRDGVIGRALVCAPGIAPMLQADARTLGERSCGRDGDTAVGQVALVALDVLLAGAVRLVHVDVARFARGVRVARDHDLAAKDHLGRLALDADAAALRARDAVARHGAVGDVDGAVVHVDAAAAGGVLLAAVVAHGDVGDRGAREEGDAAALAIGGGAPGRVPLDQARAVSAAVVIGRGQLARGGVARHVDAAARLGAGVVADARLVAKIDLRRAMEHQAATVTVVGRIGLDGRRSVQDQVERLGAVDAAAMCAGSIARDLGSVIERDVHADSGVDTAAVRRASRSLVVADLRADHRELMLVVTRRVDATARVGLVAPDVAAGDVAGSIALAQGNDNAVAGNTRVRGRAALIDPQIQASAAAARLVAADIRIAPDGHLAHAVRGGAHGGLGIVDGDAATVARGVVVTNGRAAVERNGSRVGVGIQRLLVCQSARDATAVAAGAVARNL